MSLILDVAAKVEAEFRRLWPYQDQGEFFRSREIEKEGRYYRSLSEARAHTDALQAGETSEVKSFLEAEVKKAEAKTLSAEEQRSLFREVSQNVSDLFCQITPDSIGKETPEVAGQLVELLTRFSKAYSKQGKQRSADSLLEYMLAMDYDHAFWLWERWIAACVAVGDYVSAESLIAAATDGTTPAATHFAQRARRFQPNLMVSKALIALHRDNDVERALEIAHNAKNAFGHSTEAVGAYQAITTYKEREERRQIAAKHTEKTEKVPLAGLLTNKWETES